MKRFLLPSAVVLLAGVLIGLLLWKPGTVSRGHRTQDLAQRPRGGDFVLQAWNGPVDTRDLRGRVLLIYFGYTWCPDICPTNLGYIGLALDGLTPAELERVRVLFVSVDPARDTPERLKEYAAFFHADIIGATGSPEQVATAAALFGATFRKVRPSGSQGDYLVDHSASTYVVDTSGKLFATLDHATPPERIRAVIRGLLHR